MTKEERAQIARENGAKSRGPKTEAGKQRSARNALKTGEHAHKFAHFLPPHEAMAATEDIAEYQQLVDDLIAEFQPKGRSGIELIADIAFALVQIGRLKVHLVNEWNMAYIQANRRPTVDVAAELRELQLMSDSTQSLFGTKNPVAKIHREIARLRQLIKANTRELKFLRDSFPPAQPEKQTEPKPEPPAENKDVNPSPPENDEDIPEPVFTYEHSPIVIASYRKQFPGRPIVIMPPDDEAVPKKAA